MASTKGVTEVTVTMSDGATHTITSDGSSTLDAVFFDPAAAVAAGIPMGKGPAKGVKLTTKAAPQTGRAARTATTTETTDAGICYMVGGQLICP